MATGISMNTQGSTAGNPQGGLLKGLGTIARGFLNPASAIQSLGKSPVNGMYGGNSIQGVGGSDNAAPQKGLMPTHPVSSITSSPDGTTKHTFDTSGTKTGNNSGSSGSTPDSTGGTPGISANDAAVIAQAVKQQQAVNNPTPTTPTPPTTPTVGTPTENAQNVLNQSDLNDNPEYQNLAQQQNAITTAQLEGNGAGRGLTNTLSPSQISGILGSNASLYSNLTVPGQTGGQSTIQQEQGLLNPSLGAVEAGNAAEAQRLISGGQLATSGAQSVLGASTLSPTGYGQTNTSGLTGVQGGQFGSGPEALANSQAYQTNQAAIDQINSTAPAADAAFSVLNSYAQGIDANTPISQGIQKLYGSTVQGLQSVAGFNAQLQSVRAAWKAIEGGDPIGGIPDNLTPVQLTQIQKQLKTDSQSKITGYQNENEKLISGGSSNSSGSSTGATPNPWK